MILGTPYLIWHEANSMPLATACDVVQIVGKRVVSGNQTVEWDAFFRQLFAKEPIPIGMSMDCDVPMHRRQQ